MEGLKVIYSNSVVMFGDGNYISIFYDNYIFGEKVKFKNEIMYSNSDRSVWVADLIENQKLNELVFIIWISIAVVRRIFIIYISVFLW